MATLLAFNSVDIVVTGLKIYYSGILKGCFPNNQYQSIFDTQYLFNFEHILFNVLYLALDLVFLVYVVYSLFTINDLFKTIKHLKEEDTKTKEEEERKNKIEREMVERRNVANLNSYNRINQTDVSYDLNDNKNSEIKIQSLSEC